MATRWKRKMSWIPPLIFALAGFLISACKSEIPNPVEIPEVKEPVLVTKTNPVKLYMHYMPWFQSKQYSGNWGYHWRMSNKNPEVILPNGQRQIAAHYYPLIGPYDSGDRDLIDYHLLLMKYAGVDGVMIDWYGSYDVNDYKVNGDNTNALVKRLKEVGLDFGIVYEDYTAELVSKATIYSPLEVAQQDMRYVAQNFMTSDRYIKVDGQPLLLTFGPRYFTTKNDWSQILASINLSVTFMPLWNFSNRVGTENADGEFAWIDFNASYSTLTNFYQGTNHGLTLGSVFPGYHDYYVAGGAGTSFGFVDHQNGQTLTQTLNKAQAFNIPYLQLNTFNDFGEGTMFEPTVEFQYQFLETLQTFSGVSYDKAAFESIYNYYLKRKELAGNADAQKTLDDVFTALNDLKLTTADSLLSGL